MFDDFLRKRAASLGANLINGLFMGMDLPTTADGSYKIQYNDYASGENVRAWEKPLLFSSRKCHIAFHAARSEVSAFAPAPDGGADITV